MKYPRLFTRLYNVPFALHWDKLQVIEQVFRDYAISGKPGAWSEDWPDSTPTERDSKLYSIADGGIALVPVIGTLVQRSSGMDALSGMSSYASIAASIGQALSDRSVAGILLEIDSPGGEVNGLFGLTGLIAAAKAQKPVWGMVNEMAYSAAYAIAASTDQLYLPQTAGLGSIGVIAMHVDQSGRDAKSGYTYTAIHAGAKKNDMSSHAPLSDRARTDLQAEVDRLYAMFTSHVASARGIGLEHVIGTQAGLMNPHQAVADGYADGIANLDEVLSRFRGHLATTRSSGSRTAARHASTKTTANRKETTMPGENLLDDPAVTAALATARAEGQRAGATAERARIAAILDSEHGKTRATLARSMALETDLSPEQANALLGKSPLEASAAPTKPTDSGFKAAMESLGNPVVGTDKPAADTPDSEALTLAQQILRAG